MANWDDVRFFLAVARAGSIRRAAALLGVNHATVSRRVRQLEARHGTRLFESTPSGFVLTARGEQALDLASGIELDMATLDQRMAGHDAEVDGSVRISIGDDFVARLAPLFERLRATYPALHLQIGVGHPLAHLANREVDVALRVGDDPPGPIAGRRLASMAVALYASRRYLARRRDVEDVRAFDWIGWDESWSNAHTAWMDRTIPSARVTCRVDSPGALYEMTRAGLGVAHLLCYLGDADPDLVRVVPDVTEFRAGLWLLTHPDLRGTHRIRVVLDFIAQALEQDRDLIEGRTPGARRGRPFPDPHLPVR